VLEWDCGLLFVVLPKRLGFKSLAATKFLEVPRALQVSRAFHQEINPQQTVRGFVMFRLRPISVAVATTAVAVVGKTIVEQPMCDEPSSMKLISSKTRKVQSSSPYNFPQSQLYNPTRPYPQWDAEWDVQNGLDHLPIESSADAIANADALNAEAKIEYEPTNTTRHIILIRHGQYDESSREDEKRILTPLGRTQARLTGERLSRMIQAKIDEKAGPIEGGSGGEEEKEGEADNTRIIIKAIRVSNMARAKETAELIRTALNLNLDLIVDADLNEGRPAHVIPGGSADKPRMTVDSVSEDGPRIERAFQRYFHRARILVQGGEGEGEGEGDGKEEEKKEEEQKITTSVDPADSDSPTNEKKKKNKQKRLKPTHEFEIVVCHGNVIRFFFLRALQLPPEAWLRLCSFNCSLSYFVVRPTGSVSCRTFGDIGHLGMNEATFSMHHGYNW